MKMIKFRDPTSLEVVYLRPEKVTHILEAGHKMGTDSKNRPCCLISFDGGCSAYVIGHISLVISKLQGKKSLPAEILFGSGEDLEDDEV